VGAHCTHFSHLYTRRFHAIFLFFFLSRRDYVFKRISLELLLSRVGEEEILMCPPVPTAGKPTVLISQLPLLMPREMLESSVTNFNVGTTRCDLRLLHVTGPHIFNSAAGGRRAQAMQQRDARLVSVQCVILVCEQAMKAAGKDLEFVALQQQVIVGFWFFIAAATSAAACSPSPCF
jgi:hypothetical protein